MARVRLSLDFRHRAVGVLFVNAIRMTVIPLVVAQLIVALGGQSDLAVFRRTGALSAAAMALTFGGWLAGLVPSNVFAAAADGAMLSLIVFALLFGLALARIREPQRQALLAVLTGVVDAMLVIIRVTLRAAPLGVFALSAPLAARLGLSRAAVLLKYGALVAATCSAFSLLCFNPLAVAGGRVRLTDFVRAAAPAQMLAFSTRSSLAALPVLYDHGNRQTRDISPNPETHYGWGAREINFRFQWTFPVVASRHDSSVLYTTSQFVHKSVDEGNSWTLISPDLTRADPSKLEPTPNYKRPEIGPYWGPVTRDNTGIEWYSTIFAFAESPIRKDLLWAGSDDGLVHVSRDGGRKWKNVTPPQLPEFSLISIIDPSAHDPGTAWVAATRYKLQDRRPYLLRTTDYDATWKLIVAGIPDGDFTRVIREDPGRPGLLYAGTETGVYVSFDAGDHWQPLRLNLRVTPVHDLVVHRDPRGLTYDLIAATHGRGFWILDQVNLLHQLTPANLSAPAVLLQPNPAVRLRIAAPGALIRAASSEPGGRNPPQGALFHYFLKSKAAQPAKLAILDAEDRLIREFEAPANAGANRFLWDLRYPPARVLPGTTLRGSAVAPLAPLGTYKVRLQIEGQTLNRSFQVVTDPRVRYPESELRAQFDFLIQVRDLLTETHTVVGRLRDLRRRADAWASQDPARRRAFEELNGHLYPIEERLTQYRARAVRDLSNYPSGIDNKITKLFDLASLGDAPPTDSARQTFQRLQGQMREQERALAAIVNEWDARLAPNR